MTYYRIPLIEGGQTFSVELGGTSWQVRLAWREADVNGGWYMDFIPQDDDGTKGLYGIPLVPYTDLFAQFQHLGVGHMVAGFDGREKSEFSWSDMGGVITLNWSPSDGD